MVLVHFQGGLGNQIFQYAFYLGLKSQGYMVKADLSSFHKKYEKRDFELISVFGIELEDASEEEVDKMIGTGSGIINRVRNHFLRKKNYVPEEQFDMSILLRKKNVFLDGYWQNIAFFSNVEADLRKKLSFQCKSDRAGIISRIKDCESVALHIRLGDYLEYQEIYGGVCTMEYYQKGICYLKEQLNNPVFFVFSDEIAKTKEILKREEDCFIYVEKEKHDYQDMYLMSLCKHNIIANSSFSWWAAWLNSNPEKIVIMPAGWTRMTDSEKLCCEDWIRI